MENPRRLARLVWKFFPEIAIGVIAFALVLIAPLPIWDDGTQFETLSRSILQGEYALKPGVPSMYREPGYPLFRAAVYMLGGNPSVVLFLQALLAVGTCMLWRRVWEKSRPGSGWIGAWGTLIAYGYWLFARQHAYEVLLGFLLACGMFVFQKFLAERKLALAIVAGLIFGSLSATRGVFILLAIPLAAYVLFEGWAERKRLLPGLVLFVLCAGMVPASWMLRNQIKFNTFGLASRPGLVLYARALKTDESWERYFSSLLGTFTGDAILKAVAPGLHPLDRQHTAQLDIDRERIASELGIESTDMRVDDELMKRAKKKMFRSPEAFAKYAAWTVIDDIRLVSVPSFTTPWGTMEPMFLHLDRIGLKHVLFLIVADLMNLVWLIGGAVGCILLWKKHRPTFYLAVPYLYLLIIHSPLDNTVRFSATIQPIIGAFVMLSATTLWSRVKTRIPNSGRLRRWIA